MKAKKKLGILKKPMTKRRIIIISSVTLVAVVAIVSTIFIVRAKSGSAQMQATVVSADAALGTISTSVSSTGTLENDTANDIEIPTGIKIDEVLVESGDSVKAGDVLATVDTTALGTLITSVQEEINTLDAEIAEAKSETELETIDTYVDGRVKKIYAAAGTKVSDTVAESGALMVLSLDGYLAVVLEDVSGVSEGDAAVVTLSDGTEVSGTVNSVQSSTVVVLITDNGTPLGDTVTVTNSSGTKLGTGTLIAHQGLEITGSYGTVKSVDVSENELVDVDDTLITLTNTITAQTYEELLVERTQLTTKLKTLLGYLTDSSIKATYDGIVGSVNISDGGTTSTSTTSSSSSTTTATTGATSTSSTAATTDSTQESGGIISLASVTTGGVMTVAEEEGTSATTLEAGEGAEEEDTELTEITSIDLAITQPVTGEDSQTSVTGGDGYTATISWDPGDSVYEGSTTYSARLILQAKAGYTFAAADALEIDPGNGVISGLFVNSTAEENIVTFSLTFPKTAAEETEEVEPTATPTAEATQAAETTGAAAATESASSGSGTQSSSGSSAGSSSSGSLSSGSSSGSSSSSGASSSGSSTTSSTDSSSSTSSDSSDSSSTDSDNTTVAALTVSPVENMLLTLSVDELDILSLAEGQEVDITFDAIEDETFTGTISKIADSATSTGGSSKYEVEVTVAKQDSMKAGMNASATIIIDEVENVVTIPVSALQERGDSVYVYTGTEGEDSTLTGETEVETGLSDGTTVEITSGLVEGDTVYYQQIEVQSSSEDETTTGFSMGGSMQSGEMPSGGGGEMPSGGGGFGGQ
ncbi:MAG: HlyD family efflux transporter periplasmic adaptor subunit [Lachnospiraceae bacterium]